MGETQLFASSTIDTKASISTGNGIELRANNSPYSPERALEIVCWIQFHQVTLHQRQAASGLSTMTQEQKELFDTVDLPEPGSKAL